MPGDALVTAHYRLGIGINQAFTAMGSIAKLVGATALSSEPDATARAIDDWDAASHARVKKMVDHQVRAMFFEAYCDCIVYQEQVFRRDGETRDFEEVAPGDIPHLDCFRTLEGMAK